MAIKVMADNGEEISASQDGGIYNLFAGSENAVVGGIGAELEVNYNSSSLSISVGTGEGLICGRHVTLTGSSSITLSANSSGYIVLRYDLSQLVNIVSIIGTPTIEEENLNDGGVKNDLVLGAYTTNVSGVSSFTDMRAIKTSIVPSTIDRSIHTDAIKYGNTEPLDSLGNDGDIYLMTEE